jgi:DNA-directed RNA polymerase specialized sigma24 family protein
MTENFVVKELQEIASRLTGDPDVQKDLMHEMFLHLVRMRTANPDQLLSWHLKSCEFHARNHLKPDGRTGGPVPEVVRTGTGTEGVVVDTHSTSPLVGQIEIQGERITSDVLNLILPLLSEMQQRVLYFLMKGCGVRETGRQLGITHPAVIKHRKKIARIAHELLQESEGNGVAAAVRDGAKKDDNGHVTQNSIGTGNGETHQAA